MKKKILMSLCACILSVMVIAPLNVKAELKEADSYKLFILDREGNRVTTCTFNSTTVTTNGCGTDWTDNEYGFGGFILQSNIKVPKNYTVEYSLELEVGGVNWSDGMLQTYYQYTFDGYSHLEAETKNNEVYRNHDLLITGYAKFTNNTDYDINSIEMKFINQAGSYIDLTITKINLIVFNIYDEQGRLIEKIENGINLIHEDLNGVNGWLQTLHTELYYQFNETRSALEWHFDNLVKQMDTFIKNQTSTLSQKMDDVISAIRGDDKEVGSKDDVDNSNNEMENTFNDYNDIENGIVQDFNSNIGAIRPNGDLLTNNDFINTSTFIATQMTNIYNSNDIVRMTITFGLIIGLAFTMIGISVRR